MAPPAATQGKQRTLETAMQQLAVDKELRHLLEDALILLTAYEKTRDPAVRNKLLQHIALANTRAEDL